MRRALVQKGPILGWSLVWVVMAGWLVTVPGNHSLGAPGDEAAFKTLEAEIDPVFKDSKTRKEANDRIAKVRGIISGSLPLAGNETLFEEYYTKNVFPSWTLTSEANLGSLAKDRERLLTDLGKAVPQAHDKLVELAFTHMLRIAKIPTFIRGHATTPYSSSVP
jgi:hypothetical protein